MYKTDICNNCLCVETCEICGKYPVDECEYFKNKADFVEVVRCKDCNFRGTDDCPRAYWLELEGDYVDPTEDDDFCSYGERKTDNAL